MVNRNTIAEAALVAKYEGVYQTIKTSLASSHADFASRRWEMIHLLELGNWSEENVRLFFHAHLQKHHPRVIGYKQLDRRPYNGGGSRAPLNPPGTFDDWVAAFISAHGAHPSVIPAKQTESGGVDGRLRGTAIAGSKRNLEAAALTDEDKQEGVHPAPATPTAYGQEWNVNGTATASSPALATPASDNQAGNNIVTASISSPAWTYPLAPQYAPYEQQYVQTYPYAVASSTTQVIGYYCPPTLPTTYYLPAAYGPVEPLPTFDNTPGWEFSQWFDI